MTPFLSYSKNLSADHAAICELLRSEITAAMPKATAKIFYAIPVWFIDDNPVVGYKSTPKHVNLLFWNGQSFKEAGLKAAGKFHASARRSSQTSIRSTRQCASPLAEEGSHRAPGTSKNLEAQAMVAAA